MKIGHLELPVSDPMRSLKFYTEILGFKLEANQGDRFIWLKSGGLTLLLRPGKPAAREFNVAHNICLYVSDERMAAADLAAKGVEVTQFESCHHFRDPDGHWFQLANPGEDHTQDAASGA